MLKPQLGTQLGRKSYERNAQYSLQFYRKRILFYPAQLLVKRVYLLCHFM